jgi:hypothetical protein
MQDQDCGPLASSARQEKDGLGLVVAFVTGPYQALPADLALPGLAAAKRLDTKSGQG